MADAVTSQTLANGAKRTIRAFTNVSDGTGESAVQKVNISGLIGAPTAVKILQIWWTTVGMSVKVLFDHTTDDVVAVLDGTGHMDLREFGIPDPASAGGTGDILFTTTGHTAGDTYFIVMEIGI